MWSDKNFSSLKRVAVVRLLTPWGADNRVLFHDVPYKFCYKSICPQGHHHCLELVTPDTIVEAVYELMSNKRINLMDTALETLEPILLTPRSPSIPTI